MDLEFHATSFYLRHLASLLNLLQIKIQVLTEQQLYGTVRDVRLKMTGQAKTPKLYFSAVPDDLHYQPPGLDKPLRARSGHIVYENDELVLTDVTMVTHGNEIQTSLTIEDVSTRCLLKRVKAKSEGIELSDLNYYLSSPAMPPPLRKAYREILGEYHLTNPRGRAYGDVLCLIHSDEDVEFDGIIGCYSAKVQIDKYPVTNLAGIMAASGEDLLLQDLSGVVRGSKFSLAGHVTKYRSKDPNWNVELSAHLAPKELTDLNTLTDQLETTKKVKMDSKGSLTLRAKIQGSPTSNDAQFSLFADKDDHVTLASSFGKLHQPPGVALTLDGLVTLDPKKIVLHDTHLLMGNTLINAKGEVGMVAAEDGQRQVDVTVTVPQQTSVDTLLSLVQPAMAKQVSGTVAGSFTLKGNLEHPIVLGKVAFDNIVARSMELKNLSGYIESTGPAVSEDSKDADQEAIVDEMERVPAKLSVKSVQIRNLSVKDLNAQLSIEEATAKDRSPRIAFTGGTAAVANGLMRFNGWIDLEKGALHTTAKLENASADVLSTKLGYSDEIYGKTDATVELDTHGTKPAELVDNLNGQIKLTVSNGQISRFGDLQTRLTQYNLLTQGIFGFNLNNLLQSVWPVRTGHFDTITNNVHIKDGVLYIDELRYQGHDMRLWGSGSASLEGNQLHLEVAGKIPRVADSVLGGSGVGSMSKNITLQKFMRVATFGKLQSLPALPVLGAIATDKPRTFTFDVAAPLNKPDVIASSIQKSFRWLPNKPTATAHPVPGLSGTQTAY